MGDGDDAARHPEILAPPDRAGLDAALDLVKAGLDDFGLGEQLFRPALVVGFRELGLAGLQPLDLGLLLRGALRGLRLDAAVAGGIAPLDLDHRDGPFPAGRQLVGGRLELLRGELRQQHRILEPDAVLVVPGEQVAQHLAARGLIGFHADKPGDGSCPRHPLLGEQPLHLPGRRAVALCRDLFPDRHLALAVGGDGEGLQHFEVDPVGPVGVEQFRRGVAEAEPLLDQPLRQAEPRRDGRDRLPGLHQLRERDHLVGRVHGDADDILGELEFGGLDLRRLDQAGHGMAGIENLVLDQRLYGLEAASAGDHGIALGAILFFRPIGADDQIFEQSEGGDRGLELGVGPGVGRRPADVLGGERKRAQRDLPDERFGPGGDEVMRTSLDGVWNRTEAGSGNGSRRPVRAARTPAPLRLLAALRAWAGRYGGTPATGRGCSRRQGGPWPAPRTSAVRPAVTAGSRGTSGARGGSRRYRARPRWCPAPRDCGI